MVNSVQPIQTGTASLNKIGFAAEKETAQPQVSLETPKDEFVKKESHAVRNGALAGAAAGLALVGKSVYSNIKAGNRLSLVGVGLVAAPFALAGSAVGAAVGKVIKMVSKKD